jgi:hypothetical protein
MVGPMNLKILLTILSIIATLVGVAAITRPIPFLESKGAKVTPATVIWMRQVGVLILAQGITGFLLRDQPISPAVRAFLAGAAFTQLGLFPIEIMAYRRGHLTKLSGIVPNTVLHAVLGIALLHQALF